MSAKPLSAAELLREIGLMADGPVRWGQPVRAGGPGLYVIELAAPLPAAPIDMSKVGKWIENVPGLKLDGARPTSKQVAARLASLWLPDQTVLYIGMTTVSIGGRVRAFYNTPLGDRRPHAGGHWLETLRSLRDVRVWWAATVAPEEYEDAALERFAATGPQHLPARPAGALDLPWANLKRATGERQVHGITGAVLPDVEMAAAPPTRVIELPPGDADGTSTEVKGTGSVRRGPSPTATPPRAPARASIARATAPARPPVGRRSAAAMKADRPRQPVEVTAATMTAMQVELDELTRVRRPEVVARIKSARELGDLKENSEYHAAREEQSFLEGRVRLLEDRLRFAVVTAEPTPAERGRVALGSVVKVDQDGDELTFTIVGTTEAKPGAGKISSVSPVGSALLGAVAGDVVEVRTPRGVSRYRVVAVE